MKTHCQGIAFSFVTPPMSRWEAVFYRTVTILHRQKIEECLKVSILVLKNLT